MLYCSKCGTQNDSGAQYCKNCGNSLTVVSEKPTPVALIVIAWIIILARFIPMGSLGIIFDIISIIAIIMLIIKKNKAAKINGVIMLVIWIIGFLTGFIPAFLKSYSV
jgi:uncharacterized membrane protein YvbJ